MATGTISSNKLTATIGGSNSSGPAKVSIGTLSNGIYILAINAQTGVYSQKIVVKN